MDQNHPVSHIPRSESPGFTEAAWFERNGKYIQHLIWELDARRLLPLLSLCPNLQNFALWYSGDDDLSSFLPILTAIQPRRLSLNLPALFPGNLFTTIHAQEVALRNLTHLDFIRNIHGWAEIGGIAELPSLTHLTYSGELPLEIIHNALKLCKMLQVLLHGQSSSSKGRRRSRLLTLMQSLLILVSWHLLVATGKTG
ncbi:hypothetical protein BDN72DRAFT_846248 [Pluteus cervinus]|uniref:Uncharacterized protein n=1 Tax=Pluteus cervinus TaxID=181527 RepID=A0ACD3AG24_9AGAR|nr:hypothetical protein BDN72DRAFT_846248 [Pluteus cervinus]